MAEEFAGGGVDDPDVQVGDEEQDTSSGVFVAEADAIQAIIGWPGRLVGQDVTDDAWRQWAPDCDPKPGKYTIQVRATDKTINIQTADVAPRDPHGATGYHTRTIRVAWSGSANPSSWTSSAGLL